MGSCFPGHHPCYVVQQFAVVCKYSFKYLVFVNFLYCVEKEVSFDWSDLNNRRRNGNKRLRGLNLVYISCQLSYCLLLVAYVFDRLLH